MMKKIYIKINPENFTSSWSVNELKEYDVISENYPNDYMGNEMKYQVSIEEGEAVFTIRPDIEDWEAFKEYEAGFDEFGEEERLSYEEWLNLKQDDK